MSHPVNDHGLDVIFRDARTANAFKSDDVPEVLMRAVYDLTKMGPTSANSCPARFVFVRSKEAKARLIPLMGGTNKEKTEAAPWTVIIAHDMAFTDKMSELFPHAPDAQNWFDHNREETALRNGTLQGAYLMIAARALGLDCGPMSGFDEAGVNAEFFGSEDDEMANWKVNFMCNIGHADSKATQARLPRLGFDEACRIL